MSDPDQAPLSTNDSANANLPDRPLTETRLAILLMRLLGVYFVGSGLVKLVGHMASLPFAAARPEWEELELLSVSVLWYLVISTPELFVGAYLLFGGKWVLDKLLTPIRRN